MALGWSVKNVKKKKFSEWVCLVPKSLVSYMPSFWCYLEPPKSQIRQKEPPKSSSSACPGQKTIKKLRHIKNQTYSFICYRNMPKHVQISKTRAKQNATMLHVHTVDTQNLKKNVNLICVIWNLYHLNKRYIID